MLNFLGLKLFQSKLINDWLLGEKSLVIRDAAIVFTCQLQLCILKGDNELIISHK